MPKPRKRRAFVTERIENWKKPKMLLSDQPGTSREEDSVIIQPNDEAAKKRRVRQKKRELTRVESFHHYMNDNFFSNTLTEYCHVCDRIWWSNQLRKVKENTIEWNYLVKIGYDPTVSNFKVCGTCNHDLHIRRTPHMSTVNGFVYPEELKDLPPLCPISERLISPRLPFMSIRHLRYFKGAKKLCGQVINVPVDVDNMVRVLPRSLDDDYAFTVHLKRNLINRSSYLVGCISKSVVKKWLEYLVQTPLYRKHNITIKEDDDCFTSDNPEQVIHQIKEHCTITNDRDYRTCYGEQLLSLIQETLFWNDNYFLEMAPGQNNRPLALAFDEDAEELSFPNIYYGQPREFTVSVTPYQMATSEIRRRDRRGVRSNHILYMAAKIMRLRLISSFNVMFRNNENIQTITRKDVENVEFLKETFQKNESFLSCLPNSIQYGREKKSDLFAMMRQLGKPTVFMTLSASEIHWLPLLKCVYLYQNHIPADQEIDDIVFEEMNTYQRAELVNSDPVLCCLYFDRLVNVIVNFLKYKKGPFGKYRLLDCFRRIEFQHRGSPHCHMLLWLDNEPPEGEAQFANGEDVPSIITLIDELCTVDSSLICNYTDRQLQTHAHTHTCFKKKTKKCRFGAPFWPMKQTRILLPTMEFDRVDVMEKRYKSLLKTLEQAAKFDEFKTIEEFWDEADIKNEEEYIDIIRHGISRPMIFYKRCMKDLMTSPFNPIISSVLQSNMDIQYIVDEYTCAAYVAEYVNKSERGFSSLHRELIRLRDQFPDMDYEQCMKEVGKHALNNIEMCVQEASWFLLRLPMTQSSRQVYFQPTQHPSDRHRSKKTKMQMDKENIDGDSTDVWKQNIIQYYEQRPANLSSFCLAEFVSGYDRINKRRKHEEDDSVSVSYTHLDVYKRQLLIFVDVVMFQYTLCNHAETTQKTCIRYRKD